MSCRVTLLTVLYMLLFNDGAVLFTASWVCFYQVQVYTAGASMHTDCLRTAIALPQVPLPSSTHSRLCVELLPGNHLDRTQVYVCYFSVCGQDTVIDGLLLLIFGTSEH